MRSSDSSLKDVTTSSPIYVEFSIRAGQRESDTYLVLELWAQNCNPLE